MLNKRNLVNGIVGIVALVVVALQLFISPIAGVANNHDFERNMVWGKLAYADNQGEYFNYIVKKFSINHTTPLSTYKSYSSLGLFIKSAVFVNKTVLDARIFDIRVMSVIYVVLLLIGLGVFLKASRNYPLRSIVILLSFFIFFDIGYTSYFNSFYEEPVSYVFFLLTIACVLYGISRESFDNKWLAGLVVVGTLFVTAKAQNGLCGILLALYIVRLLRAFNFNKMVACSVGTVLMTVSVLTLANPPLKDANVYNAVFNGVLPDSGSLVADLEELGLTKDFAGFVNKDYFGPGNSIHDPANVEGWRNAKMGHDKVMWFYLKHPARLLRNLSKASESAFTVRIPVLGNFEKASNVQPKGKSNVFGVWDHIKQVLVPKSLWFITVFYGGFLVVVAILYRSKIGLGDKLKLELFFVLAVMGIGQLFVAVIGDGLYDISKHLFLFNVISDMLFAVAIYWGVFQVAEAFMFKLSTGVIETAATKEEE